MDLAGLWSHVNLLSALLGLVIFTVLSWFFSRSKNLPPGPRGWPLLGYIPQLARIKEPVHEVFAKMGKKYGPVFCLKIANQLVVVLHNYDVIKEACDQFQLSGRPSFEIGQLTLPGHGILTASGAPWVELRRFSSMALRKLGMGKITFEKQISIEARYLLKEIQKQGRESFNPKEFLQNAVANIICFLVFGSRFEYTDEKFKELLETLHKSHELGGAGGVVEFVPIFAKLTFLPIVKKHMAINRAFEQMMRRLLKEHEKGYRPEISRDYTDAFYSEMKAKDSKGQPTFMNPISLFHSVSGLFGAGTETTTTTLQWVLLYMIAYPEIQAKVQQELDSVVGRDRPPQLSDKPQLVFTQAVLHEIQRVTIVPLGVPHKCMEDTTVSGYHIPKGSLLLTNLWQVLNDPCEWTNPKQFRPERFLDRHGNLVRREKFIPFGVGRRFCLGENLAKMEVFLVFTILLHHFTFKAPEGATITFKAVESLTLAPVPYKVIAVARD
ncbi:cytochrome P450 2J6-like [Acanthaster planci]|uniref:Cytochrome P450 2J6-like n=1 Tax=Acanthaster planci TaxID=133434 RepID=A0A8B7XJA0_ACAPL|nr:cytochrome P450 2J6-like [Acanthaster planci]